MKKIIFLLILVILSSFAYAGGLSDLVVQVGKDQVSDMVFQTPAGQEAYNYYYAVKDPKSFATGKVCEDESMQEACQAYQTAQGFYSSPFDAALGQLCQQESASDACQGYQQINMFKTALRDPGQLATGPLKGAAQQQITSKLDMQGMNKYMGMYGQVSGYMNILTSGKNVKGASSSGSRPSTGPTGGAVTDIREYGSGILPAFSKEADCSIGFNVVDLEGRSISDLEEGELQNVFGDIYGRNCLTKTSGDISVFFGKKEGTVKIGKNCKILKEGSSFKLVAKSEECYIESGRRKYLYLFEGDSIELNITENEVISAELHPTENTTYIFFDKSYQVKPGMIITVKNEQVEFTFLQEGTELNYAPLLGKERKITILAGDFLSIKGDKVTGEKFRIDDAEFFTSKGNANVILGNNGIAVAPGTIAIKQGIITSSSNTFTLLDEKATPPDNENWIRIGKSNFEAKSIENENLVLRVEKENNIFKMDTQDNLAMLIENGAGITAENRDNKIPLITNQDPQNGKVLIRNGKKNVIISEGKVYLTAYPDGQESVALQIENTPEKEGYVVRSGYAQNFGISSKASLEGGDSLLVDKFSTLTISEYQADADKEIQTVKQLQEKYPKINFEVKTDIKEGTVQYVDPYTLNIIDNYLASGKFQGDTFVITSKKERAGSDASKTIFIGDTYFDPNEGQTHIENYLGIVEHEGNHIVTGKIIEKETDQIDLIDPTKIGLENHETQIATELFKEITLMPEADESFNLATNAMEKVLPQIDKIGLQDQNILEFKNTIDNLIKDPSLTKQSPGALFETSHILDTLVKYPGDIDPSTLKEIKTASEKIKQLCTNAGLRRCYYFRDYSLYISQKNYGFEDLKQKSAAYNQWLQKPSFNRKPGVFPETVTVRNEASIAERQHIVATNPNPNLVEIYKKAARLDYDIGVIDKEDCELITEEKCVLCSVDSLACER